MVTLVLALSLGWIALSIVVGVVLGSAMHRLGSPGTIGGGRPQDWNVASVTKKNGAPMLVMARVTNSPSRQIHHR
ncbi:MAG: hypothetical protein QOJ52_1924 [Acidimicrobiaceae bacterium]|jgi:hypothetical protein|nr:hypothetical protein [Acidimicrobiaceae bacterium]MDQ1442384.1 hypothetical protein [Acidimicrobiaceae bacterium]